MEATEAIPNEGVSVRKPSLSWWALAALLLFALVVACVPILASCTPYQKTSKSGAEGVIVEELTTTIPGAVCRMADAASDATIIDFLCSLLLDAPPVRALAAGESQGFRVDLDRGAVFQVRVPRQKADAFARAHAPKD